MRNLAQMKEMLSDWSTVIDCLTYYANDEMSFDRGELAKKVLEELQMSREDQSDEVQS